MNKRFSIKDRIKSFDYAFQGIKIFFSTQHNSWIHLLATIFVLTAGYFLNLSSIEWLFLIIVIALVFIAEMINTAIEFLCDKISPELDPTIKKVKDISAGAVLIAAIMAILVGLTIFIPKMINLYHQ